MITLDNGVLPTKSIMTGLLTQTRNADRDRRSKSFYFRATEPNKFYRFRLLKFAPDSKFVESSNISQPRDYPFILRKVHTAWVETTDSKTGETKRYPRTIVCPTSDYVRANVALTKADCPMCAAYNKAMGALRNFKNKTLWEKAHTNEAKFEALIPVYVVNDPNYEANNNTFKVITLNKEQYERLVSVINAAQTAGTPIWNTNAVDVFLSYGKVHKSSTNKKGETYEWDANDIDRMGVTKSPYELPAITAEDIEEFHFDKDFYTIPDVAELKAFYDEYISAVKTDDIPDDDIPGAAPSAPAPKQVSKPVSPAATPSQTPAKPADDPLSGIDDLVGDIKVETPPPVGEEQSKPSVSKETISAEIDDLLAGVEL